MKHWNLNDILPEDQIESTISELQSLVPHYEEHYQRMHPDMSPEVLQELMDFDEHVTELLQKLSALAELKRTTNVKDQEAKRLQTRLETIGLQAEEVARKIWHWLQGIDGTTPLDDTNAKRLFSQMKDSFVLFYLRDSAQYSLSEREEDIIAKKNVNGISTVKELRSLITTGFTFEFQPEGQEKQIIQTQSELTSYFRSPKPEERKAAYIALLDRYDQDLDKFFSIYQSVVRDWGEMATLRGFASPISVRNHRNMVPDEAIHTLLDVCTNNRHIFHEYFRFKAEQLGKDKLSRYDIYAPLESTEEKIPYEKAEDIVLSTFQDLSETFYQYARKILDGHIDTHPDPNKRGGAFAMTITPKLTPFVMMNYTGSRSDIYTLAHELGHGIHFLYSGNHSIHSYHAPLPLAETASTLAETIVFERLFEQADEKTKEAMLVEKLSDSFATIIRQNYFVKFELLAHDIIPKGITMDELSQRYSTLLEEQFGDGVEMDERFRNEWAYIPHIFRSPFYCYAYNFGELLSLALYAKYREDPAFLGQIETILAAGGADYPENILKKVGIDMSSPEFWQAGFSVIQGWLDELKRIKHK
ncbi:MAG: M3 family oligoendopeptidase [Nanobdellota archaeon]